MTLHAKAIFRGKIVYTYRGTKDFTSLVTVKKYVQYILLHLKFDSVLNISRSQWARGLRRGPAAANLLGE